MQTPTDERSRADDREAVERTSGLLLHPTSLPGPFGTGDLGPEAERFVDWLADAGQGLWQVLPLSPPDKEFSPYKSLSAFALNPLLVSPERLYERGLVDREDVDRCRLSSPDETGSGARTGDAQFPDAARCKEKLLRRAWEKFRTLPAEEDAFDEFCFHESWWLDDHALFYALRNANGRRDWTSWTEHVTSTHRPTLEAARAVEDEARYHQFVQYVALEQWRALRRHANGRGVRLVGDLPIYVSGNSADVWAHRDIFQLDEQGEPLQVAGVPPDYFSATGQLWGNPIYDWDVLDLHGYEWWIRRFEALLAQVDLIRLDHFRGFQAYWAIPGNDDTAENGRWTRGPGARLFEALQRALCAGDPQARLPFIAEDLGVITPPVDDLRAQFQLPGLAILQFIAPGFERDTPTPNDIDVNTVAYTGTHDNDTTVGWFRNEIEPYSRRLRRVRRHIAGDPDAIAQELIELTWNCPARMALAPVQDVLGLDSDARMNWPGTTQTEHANWLWRLPAGALSEEQQERLATVTRQAGRQPARTIAPQT